jgi:hypothetical protein
MPEAGALCFAGITRLRHYYDPVRLPPWPSPRGDVEVVHLRRDGSPSLPEPPCVRAVPTTPADRNGCMCRLLPHSTRPSPKLWVGRHPHCPFRGLLRLHSRYGPHARSTAQGGLCHGASTGPVARPRRPSATSSIDNSLGGTLLHRCFALSRRTKESGHQAVRVLCAAVRR